MTEWPDRYALHAAMVWNETERKRALRDAGDKELRVPHNVVKIVKGEKVVLTTDEYREQRRADADRFARNMAALKERV